MIFGKSTREIVNGKRPKAVPSAPAPAEEQWVNPEEPETVIPGWAPAAQPAPAVPETPEPKKPKEKRGWQDVFFSWSAVVAVAICVILLVICTVSALTSHSTDSPVLPEVDGQAIVAVDADPALAGVAQPGDVVQLLTEDGQAVAALQYVEVYKAGEESLLLLVDDDQCAAVAGQEFSVALVAHEDEERAEKLLKLQKRINDPEIRLELDGDIVTTPGAQVGLGYQVGIQPEEAVLPEIRWKSSDEAVATVDGSGVVTGVAPGEATITAICGDVEASCTVRVEIPLEKIDLDIRKATLAVGEDRVVVATPVPENATGVAITWSSSDPEVATVSEDGTVVAVAPGTVTITATSGEVSQACQIMVGYHAEVIQLDRTTATLAVGKSFTLGTTAYPGTNMIDSITFESSNPKIATVDGNGKVTAVAAGKVYIVVRCGSLEVKCLVTVQAAQAAAPKQ